MPQDRDERFHNYWKNPEKVREANRAYYYKKRGLEVPEKREYKLRTSDVKAEGLMNEIKILRTVLKEKEKEIAKREAQLAEREARIKVLEESYTLKAYQPNYVKEYERKKRNPAPPKEFLEIARDYTPSFTLGKDAFK